MGAFAEGALIHQFTSTVASGGTLALTVSSTTWQRITGVNNHTITLPDATTMRRGREFVVSNESTGDVTVNFSGGALAAVVSSGRQRIFRLFANGTAAGTWTITDQVDVNGPLSIHETVGGADDKLNISPNQISASDGSTTSTPPIDDIINSFGATTIDFRTGAATGGESPAGNVLTDGGAFTLPSVTSGQFTRMAMVYKSADNKVDTTFAAASVTQVGLTNPGILFASLDGVPIGYIDLESDGSFDFKTPGSSTPTFIENSGITRFGSGSSAGAAGDTSFKAQSISSNVIKIKKGFLILNDGRELVTYNGTTNNVDLDFDLKTAVNTIGVTAPSASTTYYLYIDLTFLPTSTVTVGDVNRVAFQVQSGTSGAFIVLSTTPENTSASRYVPLAVLRTDGSSDYTEFEDLARRRHDQSSAVAISPLVGSPLDGVSIGSVGAVANARQAISASDFSGGTASFFFLDNDDGATISDDSANSNNLTKNGDPQFVAKGFFGRETVIQFDGTGDYLSSSAAFFNPGDTNFSTGGWFKQDWSLGVPTLISQVNSGADRAFRIRANTTGIIFEATNAATPGSYASVDGVTQFFENDTWHHVAMVFDTTANTIKGYIDGQLASENSLSDVNSVASAKFNIGGEQNGSDLLTGEAQDVFFVAGDALSDAEINAIYSRRYKAGASSTNNQLAGGHILTNDSFPCSDPTTGNKVIYWNLAADSNDDSGNSVNLTNNGTTPFTGSNIFGTASACADLDGTDDTFTSSSTELALGDRDQSMGIWISWDKWDTGEAGVIGQWNTATADRSIAINYGTTNVKVITSTDGTSGAGFVETNYTHDFTSGSWHHLAIVYRANTNKVTLFIDGVAQSTIHDAGGAIHSPGTPVFSIGNLPGGLFKAGRVQDAFFAQFALSDEDIAKIASSKITLTGTAAAVGCDNQIWEATFQREDSQVKNTLNEGWLLDKKDDCIYADFGTPSADCITLKLYDGGLGVTTSPAKCYDKTFTSTPAATLAHNLPSTPTSVTVLHDDLANGQFKVLEAASHIKVDSTNIYASGFGLLTIDATHPLRIIACAGAVAIGTGTSTGAAGWNVVIKSAAYTALAGDDILVDTSSPVTITLPATPTPGDKVKVTDGYNNAGTNNITVARNGSLIDAAASDFTINSNGVWTEFVYMDSTRGWVTRI